MNKPKKKKIDIHIRHDWELAGKNRVHNQACDDWEAFIKEEYDMPLQRLTPQGSEFVNNPKRCFAHIKGRLHFGFEAKKELVKLKKSLPCKLDLRKIIFEAGVELSLSQSYVLTKAVSQRINE